MRFAAPEWLPLLWLLIPLAGLLAFSLWWKKRTVEAYFRSPAIRARMLEDVSYLKKCAAGLLLLGALAGGVLALARPQWGTRLENVTRRGVDVLIAVDTSLSMETPDVPPSRLAKAKEELIALLDRLGDARVGVVSFAGTAFLQCPLTIDRAGARMFLEILDTGLINDPGTDLGQALDLARETFQRQQQKYKVLILITDGENLAGDPLEAARKAAGEGIRIYTVGIGTPSGQPIPLRNETGDVLGYKKDEAGAPVISRLDETTLDGIARAAGGRYYRASAAETEVEAIAREIDGMDKKELQSKMVRRYQERFQVPLLGAIICLVLEGLLLDRKRTLRSTACQLAGRAGGMAAWLRRKWFRRRRLAHSAKEKQL